MYTDAKPPGSGSGAAVGSAVTGATPKCVAYIDAAGALQTQAELSFEENGSSLGIPLLSVGRAAQAARQGFNWPLVQIYDNPGNGDAVVFSANTGTTNSGAGFSAEGSAKTMKMVVWSVSAPATAMGISVGNSMQVTADAPILLHSTGSNDVVFGANNIEILRMDATRNSAKLAKALIMTPTSLTGAAIAATSTLGLGNYHLSALAADRVHTLVARSSVVAGYRVTYSLVSTAGGFHVDLTPNGSDTIKGSSSPYVLSTDYQSVTLEASLTTDWIVVGSS
jgi:hypothetical protein